MNIIAHHLINNLTAVQLGSFEGLVQRVSSTTQTGVFRNPASKAQIATADGSESGRFVPINLKPIDIDADVRAR